MTRPAWRLLGGTAGVVLVLAAAATSAALQARAASGTFQSFTFNGAAGSRPYMVYTPVNYTTAERVSLIVLLHGCTQTPTDFAAGTGMNDLADQDRFIVAYPQQTSSFNAESCWNWFLPADQSRGSGEPAIIAGITQAVMATTSRWNIDPGRVFVTGMSAGAAMAVIMGATYPDLYAAIGEHSGLEYAAATDVTSGVMATQNGGPNPTTQGQAAFSAMGSNARVVPVISFQGESDTTVVPVNGDQVTQQWMETDHLASGGGYAASFGSPSSTTNGQAPGAQGHTFTVRRWTNSAGIEVQEYWTVDGMGHAWSGGSTAGSFTDPNGPGASQAMVSFFDAHPRGGGPTPSPTPSATPSPTSTPTATPSSSPTPTPGPRTTLTVGSIAAEDGSVFQRSTDGPPNSTNPYLEIGSTALGDGEVAIVSFNTSSIPAGATVVSATVTLFRYDTFPFAGDLGSMTADVAPAAGFGGSDALEQGDYGAMAAASGAVSFGALPSTAQQPMTGTLSQAAVAAIARGGHTQLRLRFQKTTNGDGSLDVVHFFSGDSAGAFVPVLNVTYD
ncbi:MAG TPA: PHB depolymerase family esterase [Candidatus Dormibacteraeota bacterium]|nr:PHB depolymerase family esterase [Candidatus Dormibacteraeota bacterium]